MDKPMFVCRVIASINHFNGIISNIDKGYMFENISIFFEKPNRILSHIFNNSWLYSMSTRTPSLGSPIQTEAFAIGKK